MNITQGKITGKKEKGGETKKKEKFSKYRHPVFRIVTSFFFFSQPTGPLSERKKRNSHPYMGVKLTIPFYDRKYILRKI